MQNFSTLRCQGAPGGGARSCKGSRGQGNQGRREMCPGPSDEGGVSWRSWGALVVWTEAVRRKGKVARAPGRRVEES